MNNQKKKELIERMITTLKDAADNPREGVDSICNLDAGLGEYTMYTAWYVVFQERIGTTFLLLGYHSKEFPIEGKCLDWCESDDNETHWTHPTYGPKRIHLANQLIEILEKKLEEL
jgi:hypothetical protein